MMIDDDDNNDNKVFVRAFKILNALTAEIIYTR